MTSKELLDIPEPSGTGLTNLLLLKKKSDGSNTKEQGTFRLPASSALLRAKDFLPQLASANADLEEKMKVESAEAYNVEHIDGSEENIIEMNLALYEQDSNSESGTDCLSDEEGDSSNNDEALFSEVTEHNIKLDPASVRKMARIEIVDSLRQTAPQSQSDKSEGSDSAQTVPDCGK